MLAWVVIYRPHPYQARPSLCPGSHSHFGTHPFLIPEKISHFFSCTYEMQISQPLCFDIHTKYPGCTIPSPQKKGTTHEHNKLPSESASHFTVQLRDGCETHCSGY